MNNRYLEKIAETAEKENDAKQYSPHYIRNTLGVGLVAGIAPAIDVRDARRSAEDAKEYHQHMRAEVDSADVQVRNTTKKLNMLREGKFHAPNMDPEVLAGRKQDLDFELRDYTNMRRNAMGRAEEALDVEKGKWVELGNHQQRAKKIALIGAGVGLAATGANHLRYKWMDNHE